MPKSNPDIKKIKSLASSYAMTIAVKMMVDNLVTGDIAFKGEIIRGTPLVRIDGSSKNYYTFFKEHYLPKLTDEFKSQDPDSYGHCLAISRFIDAVERNDENSTQKLGSIIFDQYLKIGEPDVVEYASIFDNIYSSPDFSSLTEDDIAKHKHGLKAAFVLRRTLTMCRRAGAEGELNSPGQYGTLESCLEVVVYSSLLHTERLLGHEKISGDCLSQFWFVGDYFCNIWFGASVPSSEDEKSVPLRQKIIDISRQWPKYAQNLILILDYAAIIQDRLFNIHRLNPKIDWRKKSFNIWNTYAAAAFRLGEIFSKYKNNLPFLDADIAVLKDMLHLSQPQVITEGKSDWRHLKNALTYFKSQGRYADLQLNFLEDDKVTGQDRLIAMCKDHARTLHPAPVIFVADSDTPNTINVLGGEGLNFKAWGNNVFSFCIPTPPHRKGYKNISIEFYYTDAEIATKDPKTGKRLLFSNEVDEIIKKNSTKKSSTRILKVCSPIARDELDKKIYDSDSEQITDEHGNHVACSKNDFAENVYAHADGFADFNLESFSLIFDIISEILLYAHYSTSDRS